MTYTGKVTSAESLGRILQQARLLAGLSQRELARRLGTTQKYIWELEAGKPSIVMDRLFAAMRETGMELTCIDTADAVVILSVRVSRGCELRHRVADTVVDEMPTA